MLSKFSVSVVAEFCGPSRIVLRHQSCSVKHWKACTYSPFSLLCLDLQSGLSKIFSFKSVIQSAGACCLCKFNQNGSHRIRRTEKFVEIHFNSCLCCTMPALNCYRNVNYEYRLSLSVHQRKSKLQTQHCLGEEKATSLSLLLRFHIFDALTTEPPLSCCHTCTFIQTVTFLS